MKLSLPIFVVKILETLQLAGYKSYIVGGAVRDTLNNLAVSDWDFTTNAQPKQIQTLFPESFYDNKFGTVGIAVKHLVKQFNLDKLSTKPTDLKPENVLEMTTFRSETCYTDRRRPDKVIWGKSINDDLKRRDFTINAMAILVKKFPSTDFKDSTVNLECEIIDPFAGQKDLSAKLIRSVGDPKKRFFEDALRMMRAIRIATQIGFSIETKTLSAITKYTNALKFISQERIRDELFKILASAHSKDGIKLLFSTGLLEYVLPELIRCQNVKQAGHHTKDVWNHSLDSLEACPANDPIIRLATLLHDVGKPIAFRQTNNKITFYGHEVVGARIVKKISRRLHLSNKDSRLLWILVRYHMFAYNPEMTDAAIRRFIRRVGQKNIKAMIALRTGDRIGGGSKPSSWRLEELKKRIKQVLYTPMQISDLKINGHDIMKLLKIKPGPQIGKILNSLFKEVLENSEKNSKDYLLKKAKEIYENSQRKK